MEHHHVQKGYITHRTEWAMASSSQFASSSPSGRMAHGLAQHGNLQSLLKLKHVLVTNLYGN